MALRAATARTDAPARFPEPKRQAPTALKLPEEDGVPLESPWHRLQINLLDECIHSLWSNRTNFFVGGNMFLYFSPDQDKTADYKGLDLLVAREVTLQRWRGYWAVWEEEDKVPDLVVELLSESARREDLGRKKQLYEEQLRIPEYVCFGLDPAERKSPVELHAWRLAEGGRYEAVVPDERGWVWSETLGAWLGVYGGVDNRMNAWRGLSRCPYPHPSPQPSGKRAGMSVGRARRAPTTRSPARCGLLAACASTTWTPDRLDALLCSVVGDGQLGERAQG
ncbi:MAG: Uma2 family endonuclease [Thermoflexales bacterium]|nr:Uma2 family endonuclease [Thermoflexales bacterium]